MMTNILLIVLNINVFLVMVLLLAIYGKANDLIESKEQIKYAIHEFVDGLIAGFSGKQDRE